MQINNEVATNNNSGIDSTIVNSYNTGNKGTESASAIDRLLTVQEVCELLSVKEAYIYWLTHQKKIPHIKMQGHLRFRKSVIDQWIESQEVR